MHVFVLLPMLALVVTLLTIGYMVSRGLAKAGRSAPSGRRRSVCEDWAVHD